MADGTGQGGGLPRKIGYARVSTDDQNLDLQIHALEGVGCELIFTDKISGTAHERPGLRKALRALRPGDVLVVWRLDRLGRSLEHLVELMKTLGLSGKGFHSLTETIDTTSATGRLILHVMAALSEFERSLIAERTREGLKAARRRGTRLGRPPLMDAVKLDLARQLIADRTLTMAAIADRVGVSTPTLYRALKPAA